MKGLIPRNRAERLVCGLRDYPIPSEVRVYKADTGELLRIEQPSGFKPETRTKRRGGRNHD